MSLAVPIWLLALVPWCALLVWLLSGSRQRAMVPFVQLWQSGGGLPRTRRHLHLPPVSVALALHALLLAIFAAAGLQLRRARASSLGEITIIVDHGITMSAHDRRGLRYRDTADQVSDALREHFSDGVVRLMAVPPVEPIKLHLDQFDSWARQLTPTGVDTRAQLQDDIAISKGLLLVISDQPIKTERQVIRIPPESPLEDTGISHVSASQQPAMQLMVSVRNQSSRKTATLRIDCGNQRLDRPIDLPVNGQRNYFIDLPSLAPVISAELLPHDDLEADDRAWLALEGSNPLIEPRCPISPELRRLISAYVRTRTPSEGSEHIAIVRNPSDVPMDVPAVLLPSPSRSTAKTQILAADHELTRHIDWRQLPSPLLLASTPAPDGWEPILRDEDRPLVAIRPTTPKQVWIGFDSPQWAASADYVIFWTNVFNWEAGKRQTEAAHGLDEWQDQWKPMEKIPAGLWPGLYRRSDGAIRAFDPPDVPIPPPEHTDWRAQIANLAAEAGRVDLSPWLLVAALVCLVLAAARFAPEKSVRPKAALGAPGS